MNRVVVSTPAKLNLGLEVVARRSDGFHEIVTILQAISLMDRLTLSTGRADLKADVFEVDDPSLAGDDNLVLRAVAAFRAATGIRDPLGVSLEKRIPTASGLGGASSDAAATLLGLERLWRQPLAPQRRHEMAARLGSDVPFFLASGTALATGRGEIIEPLPAPGAGCFVVLVPSVLPPLERKTAVLYASLRREDFSDGASIREQANRLARGEPLLPDLLRNTFERALYELRPELATTRDHLLTAGAPFAALSGAGPAHYTLIPTVAEAERVAARLGTIQPQAGIFCAVPVPASQARSGHPGTT